MGTAAAGPEALTSLLATYSLRAHGDAGLLSPKQHVHTSLATVKWGEAIEVR